MDKLIHFLESLDPKRLLAARTVLTVLLLVMAVFGTRLYQRVMAWVHRRLEPILPRGLHILVQGFTEPLILLTRAVLLYCASLTMPFPLIDTEVIWAVLTPFIKAAAVLLIAWGFWRSAPLCRLLLRSAEDHLDMETNQTLGLFFENIYRVVVATFAFLIVLDSFGVPVVSLVAGAGIAGLALSLAAQSTLSNLIAGITLVIERPFAIGDYIILGDYQGTVEDISFRSTRIRTPDKVVITVENSQVCSAYIQNGTDRNSRLWTFTLRLPYDTPYANLRAFCDSLELHLKEDPQLHHDSLLVTVDSVGEDGIKVLVRCYTTTSDYTVYLKVHDRVNREILILLEQHGCSLAYPPVSVYGEKAK